jgi:hypothetical protein
MKNSNTLYSKTDSLGRILSIKIPTFADNLQYELYFGKFESENKKFYESNKFVMFVKEIDGIPVTFPKTDKEALALAGRLGTEGITCIFECIEELMPTELEKETNENEEKETLKKS